VSNRRNSRRGFVARSVRLESLTYFTRERNRQRQIVVETLASPE